MRHNIYYEKLSRDMKFTGIANIISQTESQSDTVTISAKNIP